MSYPHNQFDLAFKVLHGPAPFSIHKVSGFIDVVESIDYIDPTDPILHLKYIDANGKLVSKPSLPYSFYEQYIKGMMFRIDDGDSTCNTFTLPPGVTFNNTRTLSTGPGNSGTGVYDYSVKPAYDNYWNKKCSCGTDIALKGQDNIAEMHSSYCDMYKDPKIKNRTCDCGASERQLEIHPNYLAHKVTCPAYK